MKKGKAFKILGISAGVIIVLFTALAITLKIMFPPEKVKAMIIPHVEKALDREVTVDKAGISVFPVLGVKIHGVEIANTSREQFSEDPFIVFDDFILKLKVIPLLSGSVEIGAVILKRPDILVEVDKEGSFNFDDLALMQKDTSAVEKKQETEKEGGPVLPVPLTLEKLIIKDGRIIYDDKKAGRRIVIGLMNQRVDLSLNRELDDISTTGELTLEDIAVSTGEIPVPLKGIALTFNHDLKVDLVKGTLLINDIRASLQEVYISLKGSVNNFNEKPVLDIEINTDPLSMTQLISEVPHEMVPEINKVKGRGTVRLGVKVKGGLDSLNPLLIDGRLSLKDGNIHYTDLPKTINRMNIEAEFTQNSLNLKKFSLKLGENPIALKASVNDFNDPVIDAALKAAVDLRVIKDIIVLPQGNSLKGNIKADITAKGNVDPADLTKLDIKGSVNMKDVTAVTPAVTKPVIVNGKLDFSNRQISEQMDVKIGSSSISLNGRLVNYISMILPDSTKNYPRPKLYFALKSPLLNTDEFLLQPTENTKEKEEPVQQKTESALLLAAPAPGLDLEGTIKNKKLVYQGLVLSDIDMKINALNDIIDVIINAGLFDGTFYNKLNVDTKNTENLKVRTQINIAGLEISEFVKFCESSIPDNKPLFKSFKNLDKGIGGNVSVKINILTNGGTTDQLISNLDGTIEAAFRDGVLKKSALTDGVISAIGKFVKIKDNKFKDMVFNGRFKDGKMMVDSLGINTAKLGSFKVDGYVGFDNSLGLIVEDRLTKSHSQTILKIKGKGVSAAKEGAKKALDKYGMGKVGSGVVDGVAESVGPQPDKDGRVTLVMPFGGTLSKPKLSGTPYFKKGEGSSEKPARSAKDEITEKAKQEVKKEVEKVKKKVEEKAEEKAEEIKEEIKKEQEKVEKKVEEKAEDTKKKIKKDVKKKLKGLF